MPASYKLPKIYTTMSKVKLHVVYIIDRSRAVLPMWFSLLLVLVSVSALFSPATYFDDIK